MRIDHDVIEVRLLGESGVVAPLLYATNIECLTAVAELKRLGYAATCRPERHATLIYPAEVRSH